MGYTSHVWETDTALGISSRKGMNTQNLVPITLLEGLKEPRSGKVDTSSHADQPSFLRISKFQPSQELQETTVK